MSRRPLALLTLSLVTLSLVACSDTTAPTPTSQRQIKPTATPSADACTGGFLESTGRAC